MWIFLSNAMLSVVAHRLKPEKLMVRARFREDLKRVFPGCVVVDTPTADYRFRTTVTRARLQAVMVDQIAALSYSNFKGSVREPARLSTYHRVWDVMEAAQEARFPKAPARDDAFDSAWLQAGRFGIGDGFSIADDPVLGEALS